MKTLIITFIFCASLYTGLNQLDFTELAQAMQTTTHISY